MRSKHWLALTLGVGGLLTGMSRETHAQTAAVTARGETALPALPMEHAETRSLPGGVTLSTGKATEITRLPDTKLKLDAPSGPDTRTYVYRLKRGRVDVQLTGRKKSQVAVVVITPDGQTGVVHQGDGTIIADASNISFTPRHESMLIGKGSQWRHLAPGRTFALDRKQRTLREADIPRRALVVSDTGLTLAADDGSFKSELSLDGGGSAASYEVALFRDTEHGWQLAETFRSTTGKLTLRGKGTGRYVVVARAFNQFGLEGDASAPVPLRVIGVSLPEGATLRSDGVALTRNQALRLVAAADLKMTYGSGKYFMPVPTSISLAGGKPTSVRLLDPATEQELRLQLIPLVMTAHIDLGPATAVWPADRVQARIRLLDASGKASSDTSGAKVSVSVNLEQCDVDWTVDANQLRGEIPVPTKIPGPWVVRIEVKDRHGDLIGRDFLEVASR